MTYPFKKRLRHLAQQKWLKMAFFLFVVKPTVLVALGLNVINRQALPSKGPAILAANHSSHLDTLVLMSLYPLSQLHRVRPVAAADYFMKNKWIAWFSIHCLDIIPIARDGKLPREQLLAGCYQALADQQIIVFFPEGTRSLTQQREFKLKRGIYYLTQHCPTTQVFPIILHGLDKALPKGEALLVPFNCDVIVGEALAFNDDVTAYLAELRQRYSALLSLRMTGHSD
ncbi:lysophospholipid acyltransferase family protein [Oceanisphaera avium]|uniref:1-acyl-sn-glycerol-3-phosphate acyltransferase n=1 Tax=Oceanisphaera avium TaxID=1903694 RepID=A0A1Y0CY09_9GAMM|nr:lysophospholipid acyltransferase family protein [Oceanisphaera avium]ART80179.1 1-acyl-sn-glycerol-3-phosphate acyltransferase [Oceanisphaera avium]